MAPIRPSNLTSILAVLAYRARFSPNSPAISVENDSVTYSELWQRANHAAKWLRDQGIAQGDRVLIGSTNRDLVFESAYFGAHLLNAIAVPVDVRASEEVVRYREKNTGATACVLEDVRSNLQRYLAQKAADPSPDPDSHAGNSGHIEINSSSVAEILFTSGTTGEPKGVTLTHDNIFASAKLIHQFVGNKANDTEICTLPLTHSFGLGRLRSVILAGGHIVFVPGMTFPQQVFDALHAYSGTALSCVPSGMRILLSNHKKHLATLRDKLTYIEMGSAAFSADEKRALCDLLPKTRLNMHYGLTEASRSTFSEFHNDKDYLDSVGRPSPGVTIEVRDPDGRAVTEGQCGILFVSAPTVMKGYWNNDSATNKVIDPKAGWLNTGDVGYIDRNGYVYLVGRSSDTINCGGEKIQPEPIEACALEYPGVADAGCCAIPDENGLLGEIPALCIVCNTTKINLTELSKYIRKRFSPAVTAITIVEVDKIPKTASGKIKRAEIRQKLLDHDQN